MTIPDIRPALCGRGTFNGPAAHASKFGFAPCTLDVDHAPPCHAGGDEPELPEAA